jgi:N-acetylneuraminate synthase
MGSEGIRSVIGLSLKGRRVGEGQPTFIIAEAGSNHDGRLAQAKELIDVAAEAGADAVKFQVFRAAHLYPEGVGIVQTPAGPIDLYAFLKAHEVPRTWLRPLAEYAEARGLLFLASVFDKEACDWVDEVGVTAHKIASPELTHLPLLAHAAGKGKPVILSTGLSRLGDIEEAVETIQQQGNRQIALLHCVSAYPAPPDQCNLRVIETLRRAFQLPVGFSDHTTDPTLAPRMAVAAGAALLEKHFTLSRTLSGPDHPFALEPHELAVMVRAIREVEAMSEAQRARWLETVPDGERLLGVPAKTITPAEVEIASCDRRSILASCAIAPGERLTETNTCILRSERNLTPGLHPRFWSTILGRRAVKPVGPGEGIRWEHLLDGAEGGSR